MIPKIIHYCWFGRNPLPQSAIKCINSWKKFFPDYEIKEWNEDNFDVNIISYTAEAYEAKKYAFVSDYARFWILYHHGGIYFDTDVKLLRPVDDLAARVERYPNDLHLRFELGKEYFKYGYYEDALTHLQLAQKSPKDRLWALYYLAMCFLNQGQTDMAVMQLETARDALPTMDDLKKNVIYQLGLCAEASGDLEKAYRYYKDVYSTDVGFEDLSERMLAVSQALKAQG